MNAHLRRIAFASALALCAGGALAAPATAAPAFAQVVVAPGTAQVAAAKKKVAKAKFVTKRTKHTSSSDSDLGYDIKYPVLTGGTAKQRKAVNAAVNNRIAKAKKFVNAWHADCPGAPAAFLSTKVLNASIYRGRYASVMIDTDMTSGCGGVSHQKPYTVNIDLKTGKKFSLSAVVARSGVLKWSTSDSFLSALRKRSSGCLLDEYQYSLPKSGMTWAVSGKGVLVAYARYGVGYGACGTVSARAPWTSLVKRTEFTGKTKVTVYVKGVKKIKNPGQYGPYYTGDYQVIAQRGRAVKLIHGGLAASSGLVIGKTNTKVVVNFGSDGMGSVAKAKFWRVKKGKAIGGKGFKKATKAQLKILKSQGVNLKSSFKKW